MNYVNYHTHKWYTNPIMSDSPVGYDAYIDRALELNQRVITSVEHGWQGNYFELNEKIRQKNIELQERRDKGEENVPEDLMFVFGVEAYWVKDRRINVDKDWKNDGANCHMVILAKNENGRQEINFMLSKANEDGVFNNRPRIDFDLLFKLPKDDVFITSACLQYWKYEDIDDITKKFHDYFGDNFMLEVQNHNTEKQKELNRHILKLSKKLGIKIIAGMDSHYIDETKDGIKRQKLLDSKKIKYDDEEGWYLDYPSYKEACLRFLKQGVLTKDEIIEAMNNTNIILTFDDLNLGLETRIDEKGKRYLYSEIKLPTLYPEYTQEQKDKLYKTIIFNEWNKFRIKENIPKEEYPKYKEAIKYEVNEVIKTGMSDYFIDHYYGIKLGVEKYKGRITKRGRGSAVSYFTNTLLGFSKVDRLKTPIKLYPERFLTADRILKSRSCPDIDNNVESQEPFVKGFRELLGENMVYPFLAFGTLKQSSAIKMYMSAEGVEPYIQNNVTKQLDAYDEAVKKWLNDNKDDYDTDEDRDKALNEEIKISNFISKEYQHFIEESKECQGMVTDKKSHPCGFLLLNQDIRREIGLLACIPKTDKSKKKLCACIDGATAEHYKYLKTDLLIVDVVGLIEDVWKRIGKESITNNELEKIVSSEEGKKTWDIFKNGYTCCVNQCEKKGTKHRVMAYAPTNTAEISAFVAGVRPGFKSLFQNFIDRKPYSTGVPQLDEILKDSYHYLLYQESIMTYLNWLGIDMKETYDIVKKISKKVFKKFPEQMKELKNKLKPQWIKNTNTEEGFDKTFQVVDDSGSYAFNASHSYCVGVDGVEEAYLKAYYPYEFYECALNRYDKKKNKDKMAALKKEMLEAFNISEGEYKFRKDNRQFTLDKDNKCIYPCLSSIKTIGRDVSQQLYDLRNNKYNNFLELYKDIKNNTTIKINVIELLIKLDYFSEFGKSQYLLDLIDIYNDFGNIKVIKKDKIDKLGLDECIVKKYSSKETAKQYSGINNDGLVKYLSLKVKNVDIPLKLKIKTELDNIGYIRTIKSDLAKPLYFVLDAKEYNNKRGITAYVDMYNIKNGKEVRYKANIDFDQRGMFIDEKNGVLVDIERESTKPKKKMRKDSDGNAVLDSKGKNIYDVIPGEFNNIMNEFNLY